MIRDHPTSSQLKRFMAGDLPRDQGPPIVRHLVKGCSKCSSTTSRLWEVLVTGRRAPKSEPAEYDRAFDRAWRRARALHEEMQSEAKAAAGPCRELLELAPRQQNLRVRNDPRFQTLAVCRELVEASKRATFDDAASACQLASLAREISDRLEGKRYGEAIVADARAEAWGSYANAVRVASDFEEAESAMRAARSYLEEGTGNPQEKAKYLHSLAKLLTEKGRFDESLETLRQLEGIHSSLGDKHMQGSVQLKKAFTFSKKRDAQSAIRCLTRALELLDPARDPRRQLIAMHNLANALVNAGRPQEAARHLDELRRLHEEQADRLNLLRFRWLEARVSAALGELESAEQAFSEVRRAFIDLEIGIDVALVSLDLAELLWQRGRAGDCRRRLLEAIPILRALGVHAEALAAVAFLEESLRIETATSELIRQTAAFVRRVQSEPNLRFRPAELAGS